MESSLEPPLRTNHPRHGAQRCLRWTRSPRHKLATIRGATPPVKNTLSHANKTRDSDMMEALFCKTMSYLQSKSPQDLGVRYQGLPRRFTKTISAVDSSTIALVANTLD